MRILTYSLQGREASSDGFYRDAARLTDAVLQHGEQALLPAARKLKRYVELTGAEPPRTVEEYAYDLLTLGVLCRTYMDTAAALPLGKGLLLRRLVRLRSEARSFKPAADRMRTMLGAKWLQPCSGVQAGRAAVASSSPPAPKELDRLLLWLEASGEFTQEAARLRLWQQYLRRQPAAAGRDILHTALEEAVWFEEASREALGPFTSQVESYRTLCGSEQRREDAILRSRRQVEYHLNLLGAELMNRVYHKDYMAASGHAVLLPTCLKARQGMDCAATRSGRPHHCLQCTKECRVSRIVEMSKTDGFEVILVSHESDAFSRSLTDRLARENIGIVGIACPLNLASGGLRAKAMGIPAQCVILDYCGCGAHWDDEGGFPTDLNLPRLRQIVKPDSNSLTGKRSP